MRIAFLKESDSRVIAVLVDEYHSARTSDDRVVYALEEGHGSASPEYLDTLESVGPRGYEPVRRFLASRYYPDESLQVIDWHAERIASWPTRRLIRSLS